MFIIGPFAIIVFQKWILQFQILIIHLKLYMFDVDMCVSTITTSVIFKTNHKILTIF